MQLEKKYEEARKKSIYYSMMFVPGVNLYFFSSVTTFDYAVGGHNNILLI